MLNTSLDINHETGFVVIRDENGDKVARIEAEKAILLAREILDHAEKSLRSEKYD